MWFSEIEKEMLKHIDEAEQQRVLRESAKQIYDLYAAFVAAGFTASQAMTLIIGIANGQKK